MGVSLSLEGTLQARSRKRGGQHTRTAEDQICLDAFAAFLRSDALDAGRSLGKVSRASLVGRLLPAARALVRAADLVLAYDPDLIDCADLDVVLSPACLLGQCERSADSGACQSPSCQHDSHSLAAADAAGAASSLVWLGGRAE
jgi:hypothetical protein